MRTMSWLSAIILVFALGSEALAQSKTRLWDIKLGTHVSKLPVQEFVNPTCGRSGGAPSTRVESFSDFERCRTEVETGLRELLFIYDDEWEYIARAQRDEHEIARYSANSFYSHPIITSFLVDAAGQVQGYRMITDARASNEVRINAHMISLHFKNLFSNAKWNCTDLPRTEREAAIDGLFIKRICDYSDGEQLVRVHASHRYKPGQELDDNPRDLKQAEGQFESIASLEVYRLDAVREAPCCQEYAHR